MPVDDPFDDFPDVDFDVLDKCVAQVQSQPVEPPYVLPSVQVPVPVRNPKVSPLPDSADLQFLTFSRYKVIQVDHDVHTFTKSLAVAAWDELMLHELIWAKAIHKQDQLERFYEQNNGGNAKKWPVVGYIHLRGEWYHTPVSADDTIHICSVTGLYRTDAAALPLILHTCPPSGSDMNDDLLLIVHPDMLLTPTTISETTSCNRRAILKQRLGSSGFTGRWFAKVGR
jgi:hypothetical protein